MPEPPLVRHLEQHLGRIAAGCRDPVGPPSAVQIVLFDDPPIEDAHVLSTLGLSGARLRRGDTEKWIRQELVLVFRAADGAGNFGAILHDLAEEALRRERGYDLREVIGPRGPLREGATVSAFYVSAPTFLPDTFAVCRDGESAIAIGWLIPITGSEARYARQHGADAFEEQLERAQPDLLDLRRASIV